MIERLDKEKLIMWQEPEDCIGEQALIIGRYTHTTLIQQCGALINVSNGCMPEFIKALQRSMKDA